jgi:hypothetical protein
VTQAAAAAFGGTDTRVAKTTSAKKAGGTNASTRHALTLDRQLALKLRAERRYLGTVRFFQVHRRLLGPGPQQSRAVATLRDARQRLAGLEPAIARLRRQIAERALRRLEGMPPRQAICDVFGPYCQAAVSVAWCESRLSPTAQNGQYLGLFQMGETARRLYGHGPTAHEQAVAAHRYFVDSGRDWSPWSCGWAAS